ncbi:hypothetical protein Vafri_5136 [Volvox africanus]|uniref:Uncharacterized protein n=1 Tax=Volvox africanus TaxID=51714 RepID=A0A8J4EVP7_9CHLO|nr:hypothetical protein Vafri_5136 [Volvox africanus]
MELILDEAESAFLQAILTGTEAGPVFGVARGLGVASTQWNSDIVTDTLSSGTKRTQGADAATLRVDGSCVPTSQALHSLQPHDKPSSCSTSHTISISPLPSGFTFMVQRGQPWQQDLLSGRATGSPSSIVSVTSGQQPQQDRLLNQMLGQAPPLQQQQEIISLAAGPHIHQGALSAIHAAMGTASNRGSGDDAGLFPTSPATCHQSGVTQLQLHSGTPAPSPLAATTHSPRTSTSSVLALPNSDSAISAVSDSSALAKKAAAATESLSKLHGHRRWNSANLASAPRGGISAGSSSSRSFSSAVAIPSAANSGTAAASVTGGCRSASAGSTVAITTTAVTPPAPSSRRAHGLLQRIQNLEAQLTELLLVESDGDEAGTNPTGSAAGPTASASVAICAARCLGMPAEAASVPTIPSAPFLRPTDLNHNLHRHQHGRPPCLRKGQQHPHQTVGRQAASGSTGSPQAAYSSLHQSLVFSVTEQLCRDYNSSGVALMEAGLDEAAREQLDKALLLAGPKGPLEGRVEKQRELQIVAHNNLACYYRKLRQPALALQHLQHTALLETAAAAAAVVEVCAEGRPVSSTHCAAGCDQNGGDSGSDAVGAGAGAGGDGGDVLMAGLGPGQGPTAATLLNLAACSSSLGQHTQALSYATRALQSAAGELQVRPRRAVFVFAALLILSVAVSMYGPG